MSSRAAGSLAIACATALAVWTACTDYDDQIPIADAGDDGGGATSGGASSGGGTSGATSSGGTSGDLADSGCCDCDKDGWPKKSCIDAAAPPDAAPPKFDCNDDDPTINPDLTTYSARPLQPGQDGDWNCDGHVSKDPGPPSAFSCIGFGGSCVAQDQFYVNEVPCGTSVKLGTCVKQDTKCVPVEGTQSVLQKCR